METKFVEAYAKIQKRFSKQNMNIVYMILYSKCLDIPTHKLGPKQFFYNF